LALLACFFLILFLIVGFGESEPFFPKKEGFYSSNYRKVFAPKCRCFAGPGPALGHHCRSGDKEHRYVGTSGYDRA
jgi:hypothetical protein